MQFIYRILSNLSDIPWQISYVDLKLQRVQFVFTQIEINT